MWFRRKQVRDAKVRSKSFRPSLEVLEDRRTPATAIGDFQFGLVGSQSSHHLSFGLHDGQTSGVWWDAANASVPVSGTGSFETFDQKTVDLTLTIQSGSQAGYTLQVQAIPVGNVNPGGSGFYYNDTPRAIFNLLQGSNLIDSQESHFFGFNNVDGTTLDVNLNDTGTAFIVQQLGPDLLIARVKNGLVSGMFVESGSNSTAVNGSNKFSGYAAIDTDVNGNLRVAFQGTFTSGNKSGHSIGFHASKADGLGYVSIDGGSFSPPGGATFVTTCQRLDITL